MNNAVLKEVVQNTIDAKVIFPQVVATCLNEGVESYHVDLIRNEFRFYNAQSENLVVGNGLKAERANDNFSTESVVAAIRAVQAGEIKYKEFISRILAAGCVYYIAYLAGKKVVYFGRKGESHTENFPQAK